MVRDDSVTDDLTFVPALRLSLAYMGEDYSKTYLAGTSCAAFYTGWRADSLWSGMGGSVYLFARKLEPGILNLFQAIGRDFTLVTKHETEDLWKLAVSSIDAGRPVPCVEWNPVTNRGHWAILTGYSETPRTFLGRSYASVAQEEYVPLVPSNLHYILVIGDARGEKLSPRQAASGSFRCAVEMWERGVEAGEEETAYGSAAYDRQADMIIEGMDPSRNGYGLLEHFLFWRLEVLYQCRCYAARYLGEVLGELPSGGRRHARAAKNHYTTFRAVLDDHIRFAYGAESQRLGTNLLWRIDGRRRPIRKLFSSLEGRERFADLLLSLKDLDQRAITELERASTDSV